MGLEVLADITADLWSMGPDTLPDELLAQADVALSPNQLDRWLRVDATAFGADTTGLLIPEDEEFFVGYTPLADYTDDPPAGVVIRAYTTFDTQGALQERGVWYEDGPEGNGWYRTAVYNEEWAADYGGMPFYDHLFIRAIIEYPGGERATLYPTGTPPSRIREIEADTVAPYFYSSGRTVRHTDRPITTEDQH